MNHTQDIPQGPMTVATELHHVAHMGHDVYEQCPACRAAIMIGMGATVAAVIYGGGNADTLVKWVGTFTTMSEADAYCQTKADAYPGMSVLIVDEFGSYDDGRISPPMDSIPYFVTRPVGEHMMPVYGFSRSYRHALVQHTDGAWYAHSVTINADGIATISTSGRWEYPKWIFDGDNRDAARYPHAFPNMETIAEIDAYNEVQ